MLVTGLLEFLRRAVALEVRRAVALEVRRRRAVVVRSILELPKVVAATRLLVLLRRAVALELRRRRGAGARCILERPKVVLRYRRPGSSRCLSGRTTAG